MRIKPAGTDITSCPVSNQSVRLRGTRKDLSEKEKTVWNGPAL